MAGVIGIKNRIFGFVQLWPEVKMLFVFTAVYDDGAENVISVDSKETMDWHRRECPLEDDPGWILEDDAGWQPFTSGSPLD